MNNSIDRQNFLDNLTAIETTAKLLVNAFIKKNKNDTELVLNGIHREELIKQTRTFLDEAQKIVLKISNTCNIPTDGFFQNKKIETSAVSQSSDDEGIDSKPSPPLPSKKSYSLSTITLDDIIQNRLTPKDLFPNYPLLHDPIQPNLVTIARNFREIDNLDDLMIKVCSKIFNHEELICCNYDGTNGKLPYPRHKRLLFDLIIKLILNEQNKILDDHEKHDLYNKCEKYFSNKIPLTKYRGVNIDHLIDMNEKQFICSIFPLVIPQDDIKKIISAKQDLSFQSNDNDICIYYARPIHLLWIKTKWLERYPSNEQKWSQCIDWAIEYFLDPSKTTRPSKRKTSVESIDHKRTKPSLTLEEKIQQIDRTKFNLLEYVNQLLRLISDENKQNLPTFEQLKLIENITFRYYWSINREKTWNEILDMINNIFMNESIENFRQNYSKKLLELDPSQQIEIERLLQIIV